MEKKLSILMKLWTVEAILNDLKTQTRRPINPQPIFQMTCAPSGLFVWKGEKYSGRMKNRARDKSAGFADCCRYGKIGDELYVKETFYAYGKWERTSAKTKKLGNDKWKFIDLTGKMSVKYFYENDPPKLVQKGISEKVGYYKRPAVFMPFRASRVGIKITNLRAEQIQNIFTEDIIAEGLSTNLREHDAECHLREKFSNVWDEINKDRGFGFDSKCWVWAITFEKFLLKNGAKI